MSNLLRLKECYRAWDKSKGTDAGAWFEIFADNIHIRSLGQESSALAFAGERKSKAEAAVYFSGLAAHWTMIHWTPQTFVTEGDKIAVFGTCAWTSKETGKSVETPIANLWEFKNGKAVSFTEIFDSARALAAAIP